MYNFFSFLVVFFVVFHNYCVYIYNSYMSIKYCTHCLDKQRKIDRLEAENLRLKAKLNQQKKKSQDGYFGSSTPSSKQPFKSNAAPETLNKNGGAKVGHKGAGRSSCDEVSADHTRRTLIKNMCPKCGQALSKKGTVNRSVVDLELPKTKKIFIQCEKGYCKHCKKTVQASAEIALPKCQLSNSLLSHVMNLHYGHGIPLGRVEDLLNLHHGTLLGGLHRVAALLDPMIDPLIFQFRKAKVRHADETGWRTDGHSGYGWLFCSTQTSIFRFAETRASRVPEEIFGPELLAGVLVVDRYAGYNSTPGKRQFCYSHLLRAVEDLEKEFQEESEVLAFTEAFAPLLSQAIKLRRQPITNEEFYSQAALLKEKIKTLVMASSKHLGIKDIQRIFLKNEAHLYHWADDRDVPADNNYAERELRPTVVARKVSFGSQSINGAKTRSTLMTIWFSSKKRLKENRSVETWMTSVLNQITIDPGINIVKLLPALENPNPCAPEN
jgi:transposase